MCRFCNSDLRIHPNVRHRFHSSLKGYTTILQYQQVLLSLSLTHSNCLSHFLHFNSILRHVFNRNNSAYISCYSMFCEVERIFYNNVYCCYCCVIWKYDGEDSIPRNHPGIIIGRSNNIRHIKCKYGSITCIADRVY